MPNAFANTTNAASILKIFYHKSREAIVDQLNSDIPMYRAAEKIKDGWSGSQWQTTIRTRRNPGIGATSDGGQLPAIGNQTTAYLIATAKQNYLRAGVTSFMIKSSAQDVGSYVRSAKFELKEGMNDLMNDENRQLSWNGVGTLATVASAAVASSVISVSGREAVDVAARFLDIGYVVDIWDATGTTQKASSVTINAIANADALTTNVTLSTPVTVAATDIIVRAGSLNRELSGLLYSMNAATTTIYNIDRSTTTAFRSNVTNLAGGQLTLDAMQTAYNNGLRRGGAKYSAAYCDFDSLRFYQKLLTADKRYVNEVKGDGAFGKKDQFYLEFMGLPLVPDKDQSRRIFFLDQQYWKAIVLAEMEVAEETGSQLIAQPERDQFEMRIRHFWELVNLKPSGQSALEDYVSP